MSKELKDLTARDLLNAQLGYCSDSRVMFRKVIQVKDYETETIEASMRLDSIGDKPAGERAMIIAIAQAQLEYTVYGQLHFRKLVSNEEFQKRINDNLNYVKSLGSAFDGTIDLDSIL